MPVYHLIQKSQPPAHEAQRAEKGLEPDRRLLPRIPIPRFGLFLVDRDIDGLPALLHLPGIGRRGNAESGVSAV